MKKILSIIGRIFLRAIALTIMFILYVLWTLLIIPFLIFILFAGVFNWIILGNTDFADNIFVFWWYELREDIIPDIFDKIAYYNIDKE